LKEIGSNIIACSCIRPITVPRNVQIIGLECFLHCSSLLSISLECQIEQIPPIRFSYSLLLSIVNTRTDRILCSSCFAYCKSLSTVPFEKVSQLKRIESKAFSFSALKSIIIPQCLEFLGLMCFFPFQAIRENEILLVRDGRKSSMSFLAAMIFFWTRLKYSFYALIQVICFKWWMFLRPPQRKHSNKSSTNDSIALLMRIQNSERRYKLFDEYL
jgi:hypothetical protein